MVRGDVSNAQRVEAIDLIRFLTVFGVIAVHATSFANSQGSLAANAVLQVLHVTRSVFLLVSATVLCLSWERRPLTAWGFWRRRYPLIIVPYVAWSAIYVAVFHRQGALLSVVGRFLVDLFDGGAMYHLYFLLLTFQLYLVFPALMGAARRWPGAVAPAVAVSAVFQLLFNAAVHYGWRPPVLGVWFSYPNSWLPSYLFYVVAGVAIGARLDALSRWAGRHYGLVAAAVAGAVGLAIGSYLADVTFLGYPPVKASEVFQPADALVAAALVAGQFALGVWLQDRMGDAGRARLTRGADDSFGVFLGHPLLLAGVLNAAAALGLSSALASIPSGVMEGLIVCGLAPFVYAVSLIGVDVARRTRLSLGLTGRRYPSPTPRPRPAEWAAAGPAPPPPALRRSSPRPKASTIMRTDN